MNGRERKATDRERRRTQRIDRTASLFMDDFVFLKQLLAEVELQGCLLSHLNNTSEGQGKAYKHENLKRET